MTVATTTNKTAAFVAGVSSLPFTFPVFNQDDLDVILVNTTTLVETKLTRGADYSVSLLYSGAGGGTVTLTSAIPAGSTGYVKRVLDETQEIDLKNQGDWFPEQHEEAFDRAVMLIQQLQEQLDRALKTDNAGTQYQAGGLPIKNIGDGVSTQDAVTMAQLALSATNAIAAAVAQANAFTLNLLGAVTAVVGGASVVQNSQTIPAGTTTVTFPVNFTVGIVTLDGSAQIPVKDYTHTAGTNTISFVSPTVIEMSLNAYLF